MTTFIFCSISQLFKTARQTSVVFENAARNQLATACAQRWNQKVN